MIDRYLKIMDYETLMKRIYRTPVPAKDVWGVDTFMKLCMREIGYDIPGSRDQDLERLRESFAKATKAFASYKNVENSMKDRLLKLAGQMKKLESTDEMYKVISKALEVTYPYRNWSKQH